MYSDTWPQSAVNTLTERPLDYLANGEFLSGRILPMEECRGQKNLVCYLDSLCVRWFIEDIHIF
jgi:hypothetical protein